ncbi:hypothetical protein Tco_1562503 [Tanacetum coccineum]
MNMVNIHSPRGSNDKDTRQLRNSEPSVMATAKSHKSTARWKPTGKIFKTVGLKWVPTGKIFTSSTTKVDSEPTNGSNDDITNQAFKEFSLMHKQRRPVHNSAGLALHDK